MSLQSEKNALRLIMRARRKTEFARHDHETMQGALKRHFYALGVTPEKIIAGYWAVGSEVPIGPFLTFLYQAGYILCLPVVVASHHALIFRCWTPATRLSWDDAQVLAPPSHSSCFEPDIVFTPLLAFDEKGHRLGQGLGYYDKTLWELRSKKKIAIYGVAYESQKVRQVPVDAQDYPLDGVLTEKNLYFF